jgi:hypothetical protein
MGAMRPHLSRAISSDDPELSATVEVKGGGFYRPEHVPDRAPILLTGPVASIDESGPFSIQNRKERIDQNASKYENCESVSSA